MNKLNYLAHKIEISNSLTVEKAENVCKELENYNQLDVNLIINSIGGTAYGAFDIIDKIENHRGNITAIIMGEASSAAALIAISCENVLIDPLSQLMLHYTWAKGEMTDSLKVVKGFADAKIEGICLAKAKGHYSINELKNDLRNDKTYSAYEVVNRFNNITIMTQNEKNRIIRSINL